MSVLQAIVLGIVQGLTEFLPISSSGHLILVPWLFDWQFFTQNPDLNKTFDVALHIGTFAGAAAFFRRDIAGYSAALVRSIRAHSVQTSQERLAWLLVLSTIPGLVAGALGEDFIERDLGRPWLIACWLAVFGIALSVVDRRAGRSRELGDLTTADAVWMGVAQALALAPGVSRAGITITAGRGRGLSREAAVRFSFLMSLPIIGGAGVYRGAGLAAGGFPPGTAAPFAWGMAASAVTGFGAVWLLLRWVQRRSFDAFVAYRIGAAALVVGLIAAGLRPANG